MAEKEWIIDLELDDVCPCLDPAEIIAKAEAAVKELQVKELQENGEREAVPNKVEGDGYWMACRVEMAAKESGLVPGYDKIRDVQVEGSVEDGKNETDSGPKVSIHTVCFKSASEEEETDSPRNVPIVMLHGLGGTSVEFHKNYLKLSEDRTVYGIDIPGFGLSSRATKFCTDSRDLTEEVLKCEERLVKLLETWREKEEIEEMVIVGHSFGGYVAMVYAMKHRKRVRQLVLIEPWGLLTKDESEKLKKDNPHYKHNSLHVRLAMAVSKPFKLKPFTLLRAMGNAVGVLIFGVLVHTAHEKAYGGEYSKYFICVNTIHDPSGSGEDLFRVLSGGTYMYPVRSVLSRLKELPRSPMAIIYGKNHKFKDDKEVSFVEEGNMLRDRMLEVGLKDVEVLEAPDATHHAHAENYEWFHKYMARVLKKIDAQVPENGQH